MRDYEPKYPKLRAEILRSWNTSSTPHFQSYEVQLKCKGHQGFSYCSLRVTGTLDTEIKCPQSWTGIDKKSSKVFNSVSVKAKQVESSHTCFRVFDTWQSLGKLSRNTTNHKLEHRKNNAKTFTLCVWSNEGVIQGQAIWGWIYICSRVLGTIWQFGKTV